MEKLDQAYLNDLAVRACGNSDFFAELYAAASSRMYTYVFAMAQDREMSLRMMREIWTEIHEHLPYLQNKDLFMPWAYRICVQKCMDADLCVPDSGTPVQVQNSTCTVMQIMNLPVLQSQVLFMHYAQDYPDSEISGHLNIPVSMVKRCLKHGIRHLHREGGCGLPAGNIEKISRTDVRMKATDAAVILEDVFRACGAKENKVPLEALASYTVYRKERFSMQRSVLTVLMILFAALPLLFFLPEYSVSAASGGTRGLPEYTIDVRSLLPLRSVRAFMGKSALPVYEASARTFTVEPVRNGEMKIEVELINRQSVSTVQTVTEADCSAPRLLDSKVTAQEVVLHVEDEGIGVRFRGVYALNPAGEKILPLRWEEESGEIVFGRPKENLDVYIPDHIGNTLHLAMTLKKG